MPEEVIETILTLNFSATKKAAKIINFVYATIRVVSNVGAIMNKNFTFPGKMFYLKFSYLTVGMY